MLGAVARTAGDDDAGEADHEAGGVVAPAAGRCVEGPVAKRSLKSVQTTLGFLEKLQGLDRAEAILSCLADALSPFGYSALALARFPSAAEPAGASLMLKWPEAWTRRYFEAGHLAHDPVAAHCVEAREAFSWTELPPALADRPRARQVVHEAHAFRLGEGLCVPMRSSGRRGGLSLAGEAVDTSGEVRRIASLLAAAAWGAGAPPKPDRPAGEGERLTEREREVLCWIAVGNRIHEVASLLSISEHTVVEHLKHARAKLGARNTVHAVVEAQRRGEIAL